MFFRIPKELVTSNNKVYILDTKLADVNGDGLYETLTLTGRKPYGENGFIEDITLNVKNSKIGLNLTVKPKDNSGYDPKLFIAMFEKDSTPGVFLSIDSGGSGGYSFNYVYSFKNNITKLIFDYDKFNEENVYTAVYEDYYKVSVKSEGKNLKGIIDLSTIRDKEYLSKLYDSNGKLKEPIVGGVLSLGALSPLSLNGSNIFKLLSDQRIIGLYNADTLGYVESILECSGDKFNAVVTRLVVRM